jgi:hypothetical protein
MYDDFNQPTLKDGPIGPSAPPLVVRDVIVVGDARHGGGLRAYDPIS